MTPGSLEHPRGHVDADDAAPWRHHSSGDQAVDARATAHIDYLVRGRQEPEGEGIAGAGKGGDGLLGHAGEPGLVVAKDACQLAPGVKVEAPLGVLGDGGVLRLNGVPEDGPVHVN
ncbi:MAG: hypothetical protein ACE5EL_02945 [Anaerolineae bacterium]